MIIDFRIKEALAIHKILGEHGALWLAERIACLATNGDAAGVNRFRQIAACYHQLNAPPSV